MSFIVFSPAAPEAVRAIRDAAFPERRNARTASWTTSVLPNGNKANLAVLPQHRTSISVGFMIWAALHLKAKPCARFALSGQFRNPCHEFLGVRQTFRSFCPHGA